MTEPDQEQPAPPVEAPPAPPAAEPEVEAPAEAPAAAERDPHAHQVDENLASDQVGAPPFSLSEEDGGSAAVVGHPDPYATGPEPHQEG